jgi:hypothetical protein
MISADRDPSDNGNFRREISRMTPVRPGVEVGSVFTPWVIDAALWRRQPLPQRCGAAAVVR